MLVSRKALATHGARLIGSYLIDESFLISSSITFKVMDYIGSMGITKVSKALRMLDRILSRRASLSADIVILTTKVVR